MENKSIQNNKSNSNIEMNTKDSHVSRISLCKEVRDYLTPAVFNIVMDYYYIDFKIEWSLLTKFIHPRISLAGTVFLRNNITFAYLQNILQLYKSFDHGDSFINLPRSELDLDLMIPSRDIYRSLGTKSAILKLSHVWNDNAGQWEGQGGTTSSGRTTPLGASATPSGANVTPSGRLHDPTRDVKRECSKTEYLRIIKPIKNIHMYDIIWVIKTFFHHFTFLNGTVNNIGVIKLSIPKFGTETLLYLSCDC